MLLGGGLRSPSAFLVYNAAKVRRLSTIFQVDTRKTKKERIAHVQLSQGMIYNAARVRSFSIELQFDTCKSKEDRSEHGQLHTL